MYRLWLKRKLPGLKRNVLPVQRFKELPVVMFSMAVKIRFLPKIFQKLFMQLLPYLRFRSVCE
jgi:hypothetical protein